MTSNPEAAEPREWPIREVSRACGLTSRTLRHYEQIELLSPVRVAPNGYRFYGEAELTRLYRIMSLRALDLPLAAIQRIIDDEQPLAAAIDTHLVSLTAQRDRMNQQIAVVQQTLRAVQKGQSMSIREIFNDFDNSQYETEVRERWGDAAWEASARRRESMSAGERREDDARSFDLTAALREAASAGIEPAAPAFQALIAQHYDWIAEHWGRRPERVAYLGLAQLYVTDLRFATTYGGQQNAEAIHAAIEIWAEEHLAE